MTSVDTTSQSAAKSAAIANSDTLSVADAATLVDMLLSIRVTTHSTSCLANHMRRDGVEDFADSLVDDIDFRLETLRASFRVRSSSEARALVARIEAIIGEVRHD